MSVASMLCRVPVRLARRRRAGRATWRACYMLLPPLPPSRVPVLQCAVEHSCVALSFDC